MMLVGEAVKSAKAAWEYDAEHQQLAAGGGTARGKRKVRDLRPVFVRPPTPCVDRGPESQVHGGV